ncbi:MAG: UDP-N-acetylglucosamine 2-epimerase (non-hydrolyzing) [Pseudomonadota bacterium]
MKKAQIDLIAAARPNFMKVAPLYHALTAESWCDVRLVHTGQHYDANMSSDIFDDLGLPDPHHHLGVGSGSHATQTAGVMTAYEPLCLSSPPAWIVVVGDVNSTVACTLVGAKLHIPVAHLEAGLRSGDRRMPEEINRLVTDAIADLLWTPSPDADANLAHEGVDPAKVERIGNIMIDSYELMRERIEGDGTRARMGVQGKEYGVVTLHRPANVDSRDTLEVLVEQVRSSASRLPLVFAVHPRTEKQLKEFGLYDRLVSSPGLTVTEPLSYVSFMNMVTGARLIITDSGGIQEETTYLGIPCLTVRDTTERPITIEQGTNQLVEPESLLETVDAVLAAGSDAAASRKPEFWDGKAAGRAVESLKRRLRQ